MPNQSSILVIDDKFGPRESLRIVFHREFDVICVDCVDDGLKQLTSRRPELVILDINMPGKDGIQGLREIRKCDPHVAVIMLTGFASVETARQAIRLGANEYLDKPFNVDEIRNIVRHYVELTRCAREQHKSDERIMELNDMLAGRRNRSCEFASEGLPTPVPDQTELVDSEYSSQICMALTHDDESPSSSVWQQDNQTTAIFKTDAKPTFKARRNAGSLRHQAGVRAKRTADAAVLSTENPPRQLPKHLHPDYRIAGTLGEGSMGVVYLVKNRAGRRFALKMIKTIGLDQNGFRKIKARFLHEAEAAAAVRHPNVVRLLHHHMSDDDRVAYMLMEFVDGKPLDDIIARHCQLNYKQKCKILIQVADALVAIHELDILHRDIKPGNVLVNESLRVKITDFGIAKLPDSVLTRKSDVMGSPGYMSPESFVSARVDQRADLFSFGILAYELLLGLHPFRADNYLRTCYLIRNEKQPHPLDVDPDFPPWLAAILERMLMKNPDDRYDSVMTVRQEIAGSLLRI